MNEQQLEPCRCGEIEHIYFITLHNLSRGGVVGLVQCHLCGRSVSFIAYPTDQGEFQAAGTAAWNNSNELDQLRQRVAEVEADNVRLDSECKDRIFTCRAHECHRVRVEMQQEIEVLRQRLTEIHPALHD